MQYGELRADLPASARIRYCNEDRQVRFTRDIRVSFSDQQYFEVRAILRRLRREHEERRAVPLRDTFGELAAELLRDEK